MQTEIKNVRDCETVTNENLAGLLDNSRGVKVVQQVTSIVKTTLQRVKIQVQNRNQTGQDSYLKQWFN